MWYLSAFSICHNKFNFVTTTVEMYSQYLLLLLFVKTYFFWTSLKAGNKEEKDNFSPMYLFPMSPCLHANRKCFLDVFIFFVALKHHTISIHLYESDLFFMYLDVGTYNILWMYKQKRVLLCYTYTVQTPRWYILHNDATIYSQ